MKHGNEIRVTGCEWGQVIKEGLFEEQKQTETKGEKAVSRWKFGEELFRLRKSLTESFWDRNELYVFEIQEVGTFGT